MKNSSLSIEKLIDLEIWLSENYPSNCDFDKMKEYFLSNFNHEETNYLMDAYFIPFYEIKEQLQIYDTKKPKLDELKLVRDLQTKYSVSEEQIISRIQNIRKINQYLEKHPDRKSIPIIRIHYYDKLVRDNIPDIIKKDGEIPITRVLNDEEYWNYLLKKDTEELEEVRIATSKEERKKELGDKLELLRAMAEYNGYTLQDIIEEANRKKEKNGSFTKRLLLEKIIKK